jgi:hypothetical protein
MYAVAYNGTNLFQKMVGLVWIEEQAIGLVVALFVVQTQNQLTMSCKLAFIWLEEHTTMPNNRMDC